MVEDYIRYDQLIDQAMRRVVREALLKIKEDGLQGEHHFLISFYTGFDGVEIPLHMKEKYPDDMTIVLQHQYEDLEITEEYFSVTLSFDGQRGKVKVPFAALSSFADPGVRFGLKFNIISEEAILDAMAEEAAEIEDKADTSNTTKITPKVNKKPAKNTKKTAAKKSAKKDQAADNVVDLSQFRKD